jgi:hypothetical protein
LDDPVADALAEALADEVAEAFADAGALEPATADAGAPAEAPDDVPAGGVAALTLLHPAWLAIAVPRLPVCRLVRAELESWESCCTWSLSPRRPDANSACDAVFSDCAFFCAAW